MEWNSTQHFFLIILCFIVAFIPRFVPLSFFRTRKIPKWFNEWMGYIPIALFTSLVVKDLCITSSYTLSISGKAPELIAALLVFLIAYWTRSMAISVILGLASVMLLAVFL
ncbi:AzlD domain-containing protein [Apilactobacillus bombintestini]|uniref:AzlD domain-containing protein n=1 Tax=Apilactobacillus bombintestini TaxID=2419772 RepID=A0A387AQD1_9LACO|nr:AzlD domain-containing protein [Apilactobacillus bombintestini]AYF92974.1 AzlD domain-containing protein [Apilactobacillus bombintestini]